MTYDAAGGTVIYRSTMHAGLKRNFQLMSGAAWVELLCRHIADRYEHLVHYVGWYSNRARGARAKIGAPQADVALPASGEQPSTEFSSRARAAWARLIRKVYEADPLECPKCNGRMRVIAPYMRSGDRLRKWTVTSHIDTRWRYRYDFASD